MYGGFSGSQGMIFYNTKIEGDNGVYGYYHHDELVMITGEYHELRKMQQERETDYRRKDDPLLKPMAMLFLLDLAAVVLTFVFGSFLVGTAITVLAIGSYYPILVIVFARIIDYRTKELHQQFRRFHGCEHQSISWLTRRESGQQVTAELLKKESIYDGECGTAYAGYLLTLVVVITLLIVNLASLGLLKALGILLMVILLLLINVFNPYNPYLLLQKPVVAKPEDREYILAIAIAEKLIELETGEKN